MPQIESETGAGPIGAAIGYHWPRLTTQGVSFESCPTRNRFELFPLDIEEEKATRTKLFTPAYVGTPQIIDDVQRGWRRLLGARRIGDNN